MSFFFRRSLLKKRFLFFSSHKKFSKQLPPPLLKKSEQLLDSFQKAFQEKKMDRAASVVEEMQSFSKQHFILPRWRSYLSTAMGIALALILALAFRQSVAELYKIPSGSMRPTFKEEDRLIVNKSRFGINLPWSPGHIHFQEKDLKRGQIVTLTAEGLPLADTKMHLGPFSIHKRYVKRLIAKGGDRLFFHAGRIYALDKDQNSLPIIEREYIPFVHFAGKIVQEGQNLSLLHFGQKTLDFSPLSPRKNLQEQGINWGIERYAMAKILTPAQAMASDEVPLYLQLHFSPSFGFQKKTSSLFQTQSFLFPLSQEKINLLMKAMYTERFSLQGSMHNPLSLSDGSYEFFQGKAFSVGRMGRTKALDPSAKIYNSSSQWLHILFNQGMHWTQDLQLPHRYAYFKEGDLWVMNTKLFDAKEKILEIFSLSQEKASHPFIAKAPPTPKEIWEKGLKIPQGKYLVLGDNHAQSGDGRDFGFIPQKNLRGTAWLRLWPSFELLEPQEGYTRTEISIWTSLLLLTLGWITITEKRLWDL